MVWRCIIAGNANAYDGNSACYFSKSRNFSPRCDPTIPSWSAVCITNRQRKNIHQEEPPPTEVHMFNTCFPASPFEDSAGSICKRFLSIMEEAVNSHFLESNPANSTRISTCYWLRPPVLSSTSRRAEITFSQKCGLHYKYHCVNKKLANLVHWSDHKMNMTSWPSHPIHVHMFCEFTKKKKAQKCHIAKWMGKGVGRMQKDCIHDNSDL